MEQTTRDETGRRAVGAARRAVRRVLGLDPPAPVPEYVVSAVHGTWQVCGVGGSPPFGAGGLMSGETDLRAADEGETA